ncbi:MAG: DNA repair protein RecO [Rickettsiales bacterium]|nr:DNA repair protein RecO [Rickettsiales bacterium]
MMHWEDECVVLGATKYSESAAIVCLFSRTHGIIRSIAQGGAGRKQRGVYQVGNIVQGRWSARLSEHMGNVQVEMVMPVAAFAMNSSLGLTALHSMTSLLRLAVLENDPHPLIYDHTHHLLGRIARDPSAEWLSDYARFELTLLQEAGYGLDLSTCVSTGVSESLCYVSPKSGRAVSESAGRAYHAKMLPLPAFLLGESMVNETVKTAEILDALRMSGYFLEHWMLMPTGKQMPVARERLVVLVSQVLATEA